MEITAHPTLSSMESTVNVSKDISLINLDNASSVPDKPTGMEYSVRMEEQEEVMVEAAVMVDQVEVTEEEMEGMETEED